MKNKTKAICLILLLSISLLSANGIAASDEYAALKDLTSVKTVIDFRTSNPKLAVIYLNLIHDTFKDQNLKALPEKPKFVIVFGGTSAKMLSTSRKGASPEEQKILDDIAAKLADMAQDGIRLEFCRYGARLLEVEPESDVPGITYVENGWISLIGYQANGYSFIPAY